MQVSLLIFDYRDWNLQRIIIKELSLSVKSQTKNDQLQLVNFYNQFFFFFFFNQFISQSSDLLLKDETCLTCYHGNTEKHITTSTAVTKNTKNIEARQYNVYNIFESSNESLRFTFFHCSN